jgi:hypothetical protein
LQVRPGPDPINAKIQTVSLQFGAKEAQGSKMEREIQSRTLISVKSPPNNPHQSQSMNHSRIQQARADERERESLASRKQMVLNNEQFLSGNCFPSFRSSDASTSPKTSMAIIEAPAKERQGQGQNGSLVRRDEEGDRIATNSSHTKRVVFDTHSSFPLPDADDPLPPPSPPRFSGSHMLRSLHPLHPLDDSEDEFDIDYQASGMTSETSSIQSDFSQPQQESDIDECSDGPSSALNVEGGRRSHVFSSTTTTQAPPLKPTFQDQSNQRYRGDHPEVVENAAEIDSGSKATISVGDASHPYLPFAGNLPPPSHPSYPQGLQVVQAYPPTFAEWSPTSPSSPSVSSPLYDDLVCYNDLSSFLDQSLIERSAQKVIQLPTEEQSSLGQFSGLTPSYAEQLVDLTPPKSVGGETMDISPSRKRYKLESPIREDAQGRPLNHKFSDGRPFHPNSSEEKPLVEANENDGSVSNGQNEKKRRLPESPGGWSNGKFAW